MSPTTEPTPLDRESYERLMEESLGVPFSAESLIRLAESVEERVTARMDELAGEIEPGSDWRAVFGRLREEHPPNGESVLEAYRAEVSMSAAFVRKRSLVPMPPSDLKVVEVQNPAIRQNYPLAIYLQGRLGVTIAAGPESDPGYLANHCWICIPPLAVHEGYPGHHVAFARLGYAWDEGGNWTEPIPLASLDRFYVEGWGLYAELLMLEEGYYQNPERELGAWRMLLLRATRARVDALLHGGGLTVEAAEAIYCDELQMSAEAAESEVRRHLAAPTVKASYFVGLVQLLELRRQAMESNLDLSLLEFHDRVLTEARPFAELALRQFGLELGVPGESGLVGSPLLSSAP